ncbi:AMP-binding protein [Anditalea andensis]|uniref:AMP-dependent synthetase/ligase domain-containing protein n=1 Tax=Anditalea andensis TaxID=1048983 RepID=A0A074KU63_9BACT|nr:AMP-binding protein [Anditalea andensis]KEO72459.1 hypothetical protein EL17_17110 [Anditalea andensis]
MSKIFVGNHIFTFDQIHIGDWPSLSAYIDEALGFCREWLLGTDYFWLQTSGSTGIPKKIKVHREQMTISANATRNFFKIQEEADLLCCLNTQMIGGKMMLVRAMEWKSNLYLVEPTSDPLAAFGMSQPFDFAAMVPFQVETSLDNSHSSQMLTHIKNLIIGGAPIKNDLMARVAKLPINVYQTFGMTETVSHVALAKISTDGELIYHALPGVHLSIGANSNLIISAPMAIEKTIHTNDIVSLINDHSFKWKGRSDFTINSGGIKIQPEEVEKTISKELGEYLQGKRFFIFGEKNENFGQIICLLVEDASVSDRQSEFLIQKMKEKMSRYQVPKKVFFLNSFEITASGKINRPATLEKLSL